MAAPVEVIKCATAAEFLANLAPPDNDIGPPNFASPWVYRGHADDGWELLPSAWREDGLAKFEPLRSWLAPQVDAATLGGEPEKLRLACELFAVRQFCDLADDLGLLIPDADQLPQMDHIVHLACRGPLRILDRTVKLFTDLPFAFAQHHGIPTRYLDWTRDPLVAAYFATEEIPADKRKTAEICVWSARTDRVHRTEAQPPEWVRVPRGAHGFVHAQSGVFFFCGTRYGDIIPEPTANVPLKKFALSADHVADLRKRLFGSHRISRAHLMPTLDNVAAVTKSRWSWYGK